VHSDSAIAQSRGDVGSKHGSSMRCDIGGHGLMEGGDGGGGVLVDDIRALLYGARTRKLRMALDACDGKRWRFVCVGGLNVTVIYIGICYICIRRLSSH